MLRLDVIGPKCFLLISNISSQRRTLFPFMKIPLILTDIPIGHAFRKIQLILGHENLRKFSEYFEAQNADLLRILRLKFCYVILIQKMCIRPQAKAKYLFLRTNTFACLGL